MRNQPFVAFVLSGLATAFAMISLSIAGEPAITLLNPPDRGFFSKQIVVKGIPIKAHADVDDDALLEARWRIGRMLEHAPAVAANLVDVGAELHIIGKNQVTSDLPYLRHWKGKAYESYGKTFESIDARTRGVGGLLASCGEENLLKLPSDRYRDHRDICTHEFAHTVLGFGLSPDVREIVRRQFKKSTAAGLWKTAYASTNDDEFFAELSMWYFDSRGDIGHITPKPQVGPAWFRTYDPGAFAVLDGIYSGRTRVARTVWEKLVARSPADEHKMRALSSANPTVVAFDNRTSSDLSLFFLDVAGKRKSYGKIRAGERMAQHTFATHPWLLVRPDGRAVAIFVATKNHGRAVATE
jgi:von Hippel-Lindau disease tumor suppressor protein